MGNLHSVESALLHAGADEVIVTHDADLIRSADRVVFPGVGAIRDCMSEIRRLHCDNLLDTALREQHKPVLAICVGMQALMQHSEENGGVDCLGLLEGQVRHFGSPLQDRDGGRLKVPHMGWNRVHQERPHPLWRNIADGERFYFVHSYYVDASDRSLLAGSVDYGVKADAALALDNLFAVQFHPEKSHRAGLQLLSNFLNWDGTC
ncbi:imidazole glycerol phosphate synthase subunit HisH [Congregibacter brevis]|uniref:Imidazole glycerol phosphate synthase subunit HisH n=1 Tax=Congregibacter brevis TaxID=3081201 RepID=A0ABZ0IKS3_9GAMM|nr:imidazole glycerol phosphate synthase subunit HisH [Congregibacter sp. IMCC45268]